MGFNGANFIFRGSGARSPLGSPYVSGSHCGNKAYWAGTGGRSSTFISIKNYNSGCCGNDNIFSHGYGNYGGYYGGYYGDGCYGGYGDGISEKGAWWALGIGAGIGLLASPVGGKILRGIGQGFKYAGIGIGKAATWTWNKLIKPAATWTWNSVLKPVGKAIWSGVKAVGQGIGNFFKGCWNWITGKGWNGDK